MVMCEGIAVVKKSIWPEAPVYTNIIVKCRIGEVDQCRAEIGRDVALLI